MKKLIVLAICMAGVLSAQAQGTVQFANVGGGVSAGVPGAEAGWTAQLWAGASEDSLAAVGSAANITPNAALGGLFAGGVVAVDTITPGNQGFFQVYITVPGGTDLVTSVFQNATGGAGNPPSAPAALTGLNGLTYDPVPEPSTIALGILGAGLLLWRRRK